MAAATVEQKAPIIQRKVKSRVPYFLGSRPSVQNAQILISCGIPSLDHIIGGGLPVGSILLIEEDLYGTFGKLLIKYFLAEGAVNNHALLLASKDINPNALIKELPCSVNGEGDSSSKARPASNDPMTIAWRYQNMGQVQSTPGSSDIQLGHNFDLTQSLPQSVLEKCQIFSWNGAEDTEKGIGGFINLQYSLLLSFIRDTIATGKYRVDDEPEKPNILRIGIHSLGSPLWVPSSALSPSSSCDLLKDLPRFLLCLRSLLRDAYATAVVTLPSHLFEDDSILDLCMHQSDVALRLESFAGSPHETNPAFKEYHGLLHVNKIGSFNTLVTHVPETLDLAFKLRRKKFVIEKLHLPPELQETTEREQDDDGSLGTPRMTCASSSSSKLDF